MQATAKSFGAKISFKNSENVLKLIRNKRIGVAKKILNDLSKERAPLVGGKKFHTFASAQILNTLESAEANAKQKNIDAQKLFVRIAKADKGYKFIRPKTSAKFRGRRGKITNIEIVLEER